MGTVHTLTAGAVRRRTRAWLGLAVALAAVALGGVGCQSAAKTHAAMKRAVGLSRSVPPSQFVCIVEPNIQHLPDTTRNGQPAAALLGKVYLFGPDQQPVDADGQLTVVMNDTTVRPAGQPQRVPELVHIDADKLRTLGANDERFGRHYVFLLPWPKEWADVTHVTVQARYSPSKELKVPDLFHPESRFAVNPGTPVVMDQKTGLPTSGPTPVYPTAKGVPNPDQFVKQFQAGGSTPPATPAAAFTVPPTTVSGANGAKVTAGAWAAPAPTPPTTTPPAVPTMQPPAAFGPPPVMPQMPLTLPAGAGGQPFAWPPAVGPVPPPVGPVGELRQDGALSPVVIPRQ